MWLKVSVGFRPRAAYRIADFRAYTGFKPNLGASYFSSSLEK